MTMILDHRTRQSQGRWHDASLRLGLLWQAIAQQVATWQAERSRRQTERLLEALPFDARKDIGWPSSDSTGTERR